MLTFAFAPRSIAAGLLGFGVALAGLAVMPPPAVANPGGTGLVISEVHGGGGNSGARFRNDFIELYNPTDAPISVNGMSVQWRSQNGTGAFGVTPIAGAVAPNGYFLVQEAAGTNVDAEPLPAPDASGNIAMGSSAGTALLVTGTTALTLPAGTFGGHPAVVDLVGVGSNVYETSPAPAMSNQVSVHRTDPETDTDDNGADFSPGQPLPASSTESTEPPEPPACDVPTETVGATINEIQGPGDASPLAGEGVITEGVVTATYYTGGYNGFYLQEPGSGGASDATPGVSDAVFIWGQGATEAQPAIGASVEVIGEVNEYFGTTEVVTCSGSVTAEPTALDPVAPLAFDYPADEATREAHEGMLVAPEGPFTVTDTYTTNGFAEVAVAEGTTPLIQPTEIADAQDTAAVAAVVEDNAERLITLDDGASINYLNGANMGIPLPWLGLEVPPVVGAQVSFDQPVIFERRNDLWKLQPITHLTAEGVPPVSFEGVRADNAAPAPVGGDITLATFNVLNYFPTTGEEYGCSIGDAYRDRQGNPITVNDCGSTAPRGAWNAVNLERQEIKIVHAINTLDADVVSLEEIENSVQYGKDRDFALSTLVTALNEDAGTEKWAFAPSPPADQLPPLAGQDVIRNAFIYQPAAVEPVGGSRVLTGSTAFGNAREPLAQVFQPAAGGNDDAFVVITNHFKSKGSGTNDGTGQGNANPDRINQAHALTEFADSVAGDAGVEKVFLVGDFNAYSKEDPVQVLEADGYTRIPSDTPGEFSYTFQKLVGSLDHIFANDAALGTITGSDSWAINAGEAVAYEYSRYNYNATILYDESPFRSSDHDPQIVGIDVEEPGTDKTIQVLATNDFHGRLANNPTGTEAGAAVLSGAVKQLRQENPDTVFAAAGDLIGASTFESFIQNDKPTIDALNEAGLEVSAVGNHELDQGYDDLVDRVMADYDATTNPEGGAEWQYIAANLKLKATGDPAVPATWVKDFDGIEVGFVGAVTEDLPSLVSPSGIQDVEVTDIVDSVNEEAAALEADGVDVIVLLVHEGAATTSIDSATDSSSFGQIVNGVDANVDAIVSGHTHLAYNHAVTVPEWVTEGRPVTTRPVVSAGQYGSALNQLEFTVDITTGEVEALDQNLLNLKANPTTPNYPADPVVQGIVDDAVADAEVLGAQPLGNLGGAFNRAKLANGSTENRGGESTLGNLVAEVQQWATEDPAFGAAEIAFMNPGGLRADMTGTGSGAFPRVLTYKQAAVVQPFANTLVNMQLTGANIKTVLEQQWQRDGAGNVPSRPFLRLGVSDGFEYTYDPDRTEGDRITGMWLNGDPIETATSYSVTVNSFLASGGDNFRAFTNGTGKRDTGQIDLEAMVDFMAQYDAGSPLPVDYSQRAVGVNFAPSAPSTYYPGDTVEFGLTSLAMSNATDLKDTEVTVSLNGDSLGSFPVDNTIGTAIFDEVGTASVQVELPAGTPVGPATLVVEGATTGTAALVPITVSELPSLSGVVTNDGGGPLQGVCVYLYTSMGAPSAEYATCTQSDGSYYFGGVAPGEYVVAVSDPNGNYATLWVDEPVAVTQPVTGYDLELTGKGAITGTVTAAGGGPLSNVCVFAYEEDVTTQASYASCSLADGGYGMFDVDSDRYDVAFFDTAGVYSTQWANGSPGGAPNQAGAVAVGVPAGGSVDVDAAMVATGAVTGTVTKQNGTPAANVCVYLYTNPAGPAVHATCTAADGTYWIGGVTAASNYKVGFADPAGQLMTQWWNSTASGAATYAAGSTITLTGGQTRSGVNAQMAPVP